MCSSVCGVERVGREGTFAETPVPGAGQEAQGEGRECPENPGVLGSGPRTLVALWGESSGAVTNEEMT